MTMTTTTTTNDRTRWHVATWLGKAQGVVFVAAVTLATPGLLAAQDVNPWEQAVLALQEAMTGPIARGLSLVAIVIGGLMFAFGEGGAKRTLAGIIFGLGMAMGAAGFMSWLFE